MLQVWNRISLNRMISVKKFCELKLIISIVKGSKRKSHALLKYNNLCVQIKKSLLLLRIMEAEPVVLTLTFTHLFLMSSIAPFQLRYCSEQKKIKSRNASDWKTQLREKNQILKNRVYMISVCIASIQ